MNNTIITNVSKFSNESSISLVVHLGDGQSYRINVSDDTQLRIGIEGIKLAFPQFIALSDQATCFELLRGKINGHKVGYELVPSKKLDAKGVPYMNVRLAPALAEATDEQLAALLGFTATDGL